MLDICPQIQMASDWKVCLVIISNTVLKWGTNLGPLINQVHALLSWMMRDVTEWEKE